MSHPDAPAYLTEVAVDPTDVEIVVWYLWSHEPPPEAVEELITPSGVVVLRAGARDAGHTESMAAKLRPRWVPRVVQLAQRTVRRAADRWKLGAATVRVGGIDVRPSWIDRDRRGQAAGAIEVVLDTTNAFGIGSHPTTQMLLAMLQRAGLQGAEVLDLGCGTGVLAIAAAKLGARSVVAIDIDLEAVATASANVLRNGVDDIVTVSSTPLERITGTFDLIAANLSAGALASLATPMLTRARPGGALLLSGVLADQEEEVLGAFAGCRVLDRAEGDGWVALTLRCP
ncbi:MAG: 50S ribosomal protein L11 methyltransferase [Acidimicrobiales bacterium]|nr:50S ribosomal protein L11 methyltransferase [Acidimicrobiales bacterium]